MVEKSLVHMCKSQIILAISHASPAWYPYTTDQQRAELEKSQKLALRVIYNNHKHYSDRLAAANINTLSEALNMNCHAYANRFKNGQEHLLRHQLTQKPSTRPIRSTSSNFYIKRSRTVKRGQSILANPKYI